MEARFNIKCLYLKLIRREQVTNTFSLFLNPPPPLESTISLSSSPAFLSFHPNSVLFGLSGAAPSLAGCGGASDSTCFLFLPMRLTELINLNPGALFCATTGKGLHFTDSELLITTTWALGFCSGIYSMEQEEGNFNVPVIWRGKKFMVTINSGAFLKEFGDKVQTLTDVKADTLKLIIPQSFGKTSQLLEPFSAEHSYLRMQDTAILKAKSIRMMGILKDELDEVLRSAKENQRILGFEEEEKRMKMRRSYGLFSSLKLPEGPYIFCGFQTLELPGIQLNPPPSESLKRMHMLAADPGIVAIMNKHKWRVGIMTELAPVGYVGISPKCLLGFNKNQGEEISLRLRTDDLKGFRKYESIKKTLLHELAHMVYSEHDADFYALDKQLNREATTLDWTRSSSHTLSGMTSWAPDNVDAMLESETSAPHKLGGRTADMSACARVASVAAAYHRLAGASSARELQDEPDPDDSILESGNEEALIMSNQREESFHLDHGPNPDECLQDQVMFEPDSAEVTLGRELNNVETNKITHAEPDPDDMMDASGVDINQVESEPNDQELLQRIQDPVVVFCNRLTKAIEVLRAEVNSTDEYLVLQTLYKITRNVLENPNDLRYRRLRKGNSAIQKSIAKYKGAMEVLFLIGFSEEEVVDDTYLVLKRDDPGLLWLAKSFLEESSWSCFV
ncbi:hypothetical protein V2J09_005109 [Rumex salicifolius]